MLLLTLCLQCSYTFKQNEQELKTAQDLADSYTNVPPEITDKINTLTKEVESFYVHKAKGAVIRSRTQLIDEI